MDGSADDSQQSELARDNSRFVGRLAELLDHGFVPFLHGEVTIDLAVGCTILSGDTILKNLAASDALRLDHAVFLTDVDGVFDRPPDGDPDARLIREIAVAADGDFEIPETDTAAHDSTGGIATKIKSAVDVAIRGTRVCIVKAGTDAAAVALSGGVPDIGTTIYQQHRAWL